MKRSYFDVLDAAAQSHVPDEMNLFPEIAGKLERKPLMHTLRTRPALFILVILMALSLLSGVVYAVGRSLGYIPGVGIVDQDAPIRILAEPVSQTRDGITLTIEQAILTSEKTFLVYSVDGIPQDARPKGEGGFFCSPSSPTLLLPDGSELRLTDGGGDGWENGYRDSIYYAPIPADVNTVAFVLPCLMDVAPNAAPQDWELTLKFVPAPADISISTVIEVATPQPPATLAPDSVSLTESAPFMGLRYQLQAVQQTERGYILDTGLNWDVGLYADYAVGTGADVVLTDSTGQTLSLSRLDTAVSTDPHQTSLRYSLNSLSFAAPLTLTLPWVGANLPLENTPHFTFDPGPNPQPGQEWQLNQTIEILGQPVKIISARYVTRDDLQNEDWIRFMPEEMYGFEFTLEVEPVFRNIMLTVQSGYSADGGAGGSPTILNENGIIKAYAMMGGEIVAPLEIGIPYLEISHPWQITFDPAAMADGASVQSGTLGISLQIEKVIPVDDGYYLLGRTSWNDPAITEIGISGWDTKLLDENGMEYPIEPVQLDEIGIPDAQPAQWAFKVYGHALPSSLTIQVEQAYLQLLQPYTFSFDPGTNPQVGQEWQIDQTLEILGHKAAVLTATFIQQGDSQGLRFFIRADSELQGVPLSIEGGVRNDYGGSFGGQSRDKNGIMSVDVLSNGQFGGPVLMGVRGIVLNGKWQTTWSPPASNADDVPVTVPEACITLENWKQAEDKDAPLPSGLPEKILVMRGALSPDPSLFIISLDGSSEQELVFGQGSLSPSGTKLVYSDEQNRLVIMDVASGQKSVLGDDYLSPLWSPDGKKIVAPHLTDKGYNIFVLDENGSNPRALTDTTAFIGLAGWSGDEYVLIQSGNEIELLNVSDGSRQTLLTTDYDSYGSPSAAISPDGQWLVYLEHVVGKMSPGIYVSRLDGSEKRLLVQLDHWMIFPSLFSPDGNWLAINVMNTDFSNTPMTPALINLETCQIIPLPGVDGEIKGWVNP